MRVGGAQPPHPPAPEPRREPVGEFVDRGVLYRPALELELARAERLEPWHDKADHIEAETGIERIGETVHTLGEQTPAEAGVARPVAGLDRDPPPEAVDPHAGGAKMAPTAAAFGRGLHPLEGEAREEEGRA